MTQLDRIEKLIKGLYKEEEPPVVDDEFGGETWHMDYVAIGQVVVDIYNDGKTISNYEGLSCEVKPVEYAHHAYVQFKVEGGKAIWVPVARALDGDPAALNQVGNYVSTRVKYTMPIWMDKGWAEYR